MKNTNKLTFSFIFINFWFFIKEEKSIRRIDKKKKKYKKVLLGLLSTFFKARYFFEGMDWFWLYALIIESSYFLKLKAVWIICQDDLKMSHVSNGIKYYALFHFLFYLFYKKKCEWKQDRLFMAFFL